MDTIKIKRGPKYKLPKKAPIGELLYCTDTNELYIGRGDSEPPSLIGSMSPDDFTKLIGSEGIVSGLEKEETNVIIDRKAERGEILGGLFKRTQRLYDSISLTVTDNLNLDENYRIIESIGSVEIITCCIVTNSTDSNVRLDSTINEGKLISVIERLLSKNIKIKGIKPHIMLPGYDDGFDRGSYRPSNPAEFFRLWRDILENHIRICVRYKIPTLCLGTEMSYLTSNKYISNWKSIVSRLKGIDHNIKLSFAHKTSESCRILLDESNGVSTVERIEGLDYFGFTFYPRVTTNGDIFISKFKGYYVAELPILIKEIMAKESYILEVGCSYSPGNNSGVIEPTEYRGSNSEYPQSLYYNVVLGLLTNTINIVGISLWSRNSPFTPYGSNIDIVSKYLGGVK